MIPVTAEDVAREKRRKSIVWIAAILVALVGLWFAYRKMTTPREAREAYDAGQRLFKATRYEQAALNFSRTIDLQPGFADAYRMRARVYVAQSNPDGAIRDFSKVLELDRNDAGAMVERGFAWMEKKEYSNAVADAGAALALNAKLGKAYTLRATARRAMGDNAKALEDFTVAVQLDPSLENYFQRASTYQLAGKQDLAIADFTSAITIDPSEPHIYFARAQSKAATGDARGARDDIAAGRKIDGW